MSCIDNNAAISLVKKIKPTRNTNEWVAHVQFTYMLPQPALSVDCKGKYVRNYAVVVMEQYKTRGTCLLLYSADFGLWGR